MARLILNCEGVGLVMRELGCDIVMIGRAPANQIVIDQTLDGFGRSCSAPSDATSTRAREILLNASRLFSTVCDILAAKMRKSLQRVANTEPLECPASATACNAVKIRARTLS